MDSSEIPPIVGIGASAGGIEAFRGFFENMPPDSGMAFVVVLHLPADRLSILPDILGRWTAMRVVEATDGCAVEANCVYVPPSGVGIQLRDGLLHLHARLNNEPRELTPITMFFDSLAAELREDAIGVVLSGTGNDGSLGLKAIKACGGLTLAQGSDTGRPQYEGMPASAIATGAVDIIASAEAMPAQIIAVQEARRSPVELAELSAENTGAARICNVVLRQTGHDFRGYKENTFLRRIQRRMHVLNVSTLEAYAARVEHDPGEVAMLFQDLLIGVTSFFRDADTFEALNRIVVPRLFKDKSTEDTVRVWVPGCATGEEAYSLAILLREHVDGLAGPAPGIKIMATDIDELAIAAARAGRYPSTLLKGLSPERLSRFFVMGADGSYTVSKEIRALCTFSSHSLTRDPPFSRINLVSCRNLLIYMDSDLQATVIPAFHYSLVPNGILLLGSSETVARQEALFAPLDKAHRIFQRCDGASPPLRLPGKTAVRELLHSTNATPLKAPGAASRASSRASERVLERFGPAFVVVTAQGEIVQYSSRTGRYLEPAAGLASHNVLDMARGGLRIHIRTALKQAIETGRPVQHTGVSVAVPGEQNQVIVLSVEPLRESAGDTRYLVMFIEDGQPHHRATDTRPAGPPDDHPTLTSDQQLEIELRETREQLQSITEEHDNALEELRSTNEELHSLNEELQSANEELETSREEIQSINEELQTVNAQFASKVDQLDRQNSDLQNLFEGTQVATIFLSPYLVIRGFTPAVAEVYNLIPSDVGRPLTDIVSRLSYSELRDDVKRVLDTLEPLERRVERDDHAAYYLMRILPYRTAESTVDGAIVTFVDVTSIVKAEQHQRLLVDELNHRVKNMLAVVISLAAQTMRRSETIEQFSNTFLGRIHALAAVYAILSRESWQTVSLRDVISEEIRPFLAEDGKNVTLTGPFVRLRSQAGLSLGLAIHELTTNAAKYGALAVPEGIVTVTWQVEKGADGSRLLLQWVEENGPRVEVPEHRGCGMMLIERGLKQDMQAEVTIEFAAKGLRVTLSAPLQSKEAVQGQTGAEP